MPNRPLVLQEAAQLVQRERAVLMAHLEGFGSVAGVARGKGEIIDGISTNGVFVINADDKYFDFWLIILSTINSFQVEFSPLEG